VIKFSWNGVPQPVSRVPPPEIAVLPPKLPFGQLIFGKIIKIVAECQVLRLAPNSAPDAAGGSLQHSHGLTVPTALTLDLKGLLLAEWWGGEGKERKREGKGREREEDNLELPPTYPTPTFE